MLIDEIQSFARDFINVKSFRTTSRKVKIREAYKALTGEEIKVTCNTCYIEALLIILNSQPMATRKYELKKGVLLQTFGDASKTCTNDTITDELGDWYMENDPSKKIFFSRYPGTPDVAPNIKIIPPTIKIIPPTEPVFEPLPEADNTEKVSEPILKNQKGEIVKGSEEVPDIAEKLIKSVTQTPNKRGRKSGK